MYRFKHRQLILNFAALSTTLVFLIDASGENAEQKRFDDGFAIGSVWAGILTQAGDHPKLSAKPPRYDVTLTITARNADEFVAELFEAAGGLTLTYRVAGKLRVEPDRNRVGLSFRSLELIDRSRVAKSVTGVLYAGCVVDDQLVGIWKFKRNQKGITLRGEFSLKPVNAPSNRSNEAREAP